MKLGVPKETRAGERRVALVPAELSRIGGVDVLVQRGAGEESLFSDADYEAAGAVIVDGAKALFSQADMVVKVQPPTVEEVALLREGSSHLSFLAPSSYLDVVRELAARCVDAYSFELVPRISRAQVMDALSSQATVAGYRAALIGAGALLKFFPLFMTAAGTVPPARVLVMGAGVAGLQAIATSRRLGAVVSAYDVRSAARDEVKSLGASFLELPLEAQEGSGGYAAAQSEEFLARQQEMIASHVGASDVVITTAAIPGRRAPVLVTADMVRSMRRGSVIVDLAAATGGNCELTVDGKEVVVGGVRIIAASELASTMPTHASTLYARNVSSFLKLLVKDGELAPDRTDEIVDKSAVTLAGAVHFEPARTALEELGVIYDSVDLLVVFVLAVFVGFEVISKVPSILHTPLMSGSNAIHGIILVGAMAIASQAHGAMQTSLAFVAVFLATLNIVGGVVVTDRMLDMFKGRPQPKGKSEDATKTGKEG